MGILFEKFMAETDFVKSVPGRVVDQGRHHHFQRQVDLLRRQQGFRVDPPVVEHEAFRFNVPEELEPILKTISIRIYDQNQI
jgi:hypothetical protein